MLIWSKVALVGGNFIRDICEGGAAVSYLLWAWFPCAQAVTLKMNEMEQMLLFRPVHTQQRGWTCNGAKAAFCCHSRNGPKDMKKRQAGVTPS